MELNLRNIFQAPRMPDPHRRLAVIVSDWHRFTLPCRKGQRPRAAFDTIPQNLLTVHTSCVAVRALVPEIPEGYRATVLWRWISRRLVAQFRVSGRASVWLSTAEGRHPLDDYSSAPSFRRNTSGHLQMTCRNRNSWCDLICQPLGRLRPAYPYDAVLSVWTTAVCCYELCR